MSRAHLVAAAVGAGAALVVAWWAWEIAWAAATEAAYSRKWLEVDE